MSSRNALPLYKLQSNAWCSLKDKEKLAMFLLNAYKDDKSQVTNPLFVLREIDLKDPVKTLIFLDSIGLIGYIPGEPIDIM